MNEKTRNYVENCLSLRILSGVFLDKKIYFIFALIPEEAAQIAQRIQSQLKTTITSLYRNRDSLPCELGKNSFLTTGNRRRYCALLRPTAHQKAHNNQLRSKLRPWLNFPNDAISSNIVEDKRLLKAIFLINKFINNLIMYSMKHDGKKKTYHFCIAGGKLSNNRRRNKSWTPIFWVSILTVGLSFVSRVVHFSDQKIFKMKTFT